VRMALRALMLMNVLKWRLQERKRQHEVHKNGKATSHRHILPTYLFRGTFFLYSWSDRSEHDEERAAEKIGDLISRNSCAPKASGACFCV
jgi:hypothetical protein